MSTVSIIAHILAFFAIGLAAFSLYALARLPWIHKKGMRVLDDVHAYNVRKIYAGEYSECMEYDVIASVDKMLFSLSWNVRDFVRPDAWEKLYGTTEPA